MNYRLISAAELDEGLGKRWAQIQAEHALYSSPYFRPEFTQSVAAVRDDVRICVLEDANRVVGVFPFHYWRGGIARPVGLGFSDHHGAVVEPNMDWTADELMRACKVVRWPFDHLVAAQPQWRSFVRKVEASPTIDTTVSFDVYIDAKRKSLEVALRRRRKLARERGPCRVEFHSLDSSLLDTVFRWKGEQCRRTGATDFFALGWTADLLHRIHDFQSEDFAGALSALWSGDELLALHFGIRSRDVWHYWFPVYNPEFGQYSPGLVLLLELVHHACQGQTRYIDLGKDLSQYKEQFMTGSVMIAEGVATRPSLINGVYGLHGQLEHLARNSVLRPLLRGPGRLLRQLERRSRYR